MVVVCKHFLFMVEFLIQNMRFFGSYTNRGARNLSDAISPSVLSARWLATMGRVGTVGTLLPKTETA